jgi:hypothetical protein
MQVSREANQIEARYHSLGHVRARIRPVEAGGEALAQTLDELGYRDLALAQHQEVDLFVNVWLSYCPKIWSKQAGLGLVLPANPASLFLFPCYRPPVQFGFQLHYNSTGASSKGTWARLLNMPVERRLVHGFEDIDVVSRFACS